MQENNAKAILKRYNLLRFACLCPAIIITLSVIIFAKKNIVILLTLLLYLAANRIINRYFFNKYINSILFWDLNPSMYNAVFEAEKITSYHLFEKIFFAFYTGDFQTVINICYAKLGEQNKRVEKYRYLYLLFLARTYFYLGDFENLRLICDRFKTTTEADPKGEKIRNGFSFFKYANLYLDGNFAECKAYYEKLLQKKETGFSKNKINDIQVNLNYAIVCYKLQETETAEEIFNSIVTQAPDLYFAVIAKGYLDAIKDGVEYRCEYEKIEIDEEYVLPTPQKPLKKRNLIIAIIIGVVIALISFGVRSRLATPVHFKGLDFSSTHSDIEELYGKPKSTNGSSDFYDAEFLGVEGSLKVLYLDDRNNVYTVSFTIDSKDFESKKEYEKAVHKTQKYFDYILSDYQKSYQNDEHGDVIFWQKNSKYSYSMQSMELTSLEPEYEKSEITVFYFMKNIDYLI